MRKAPSRPLSQDFLVRSAIALALFGSACRAEITPTETQASETGAGTEGSESGEAFVPSLDAGCSCLCDPCAQDCGEKDGVERNCVLDGAYEQGSWVTRCVELPQEPLGSGEACELSYVPYQDPCALDLSCIPAQVGGSAGTCQPTAVCE